MMTDSFRGEEHKFVTAPRMTLFAYKISNDGSTKITQSGKVSNAFQEYYDNIAALTTWSIQVPDEYNHRSLNLEGLTQVKLVIKGTRVPQPDASDSRDRDPKPDQDPTKKMVLVQFLSQEDPRNTKLGQRVMT